MTEPLVKWAGGKRRMIGQLTPLILSRLAPGGRYFEPFLGAGAVALSIGAPVVASDLCEPLVDMWLAIRDCCAQVSLLLDDLARNHSRDYYYQVRSWLPTDRVEIAARFIYLNKAGFNGLYRVNQSGGFNVPFGSRKRLSVPSLDQIQEISDQISTWSLEVSDFEPVVERAVEGDVVYADPPYDGTFSYSSGFDADDQARLAACLRRAARRGVGIVATNSHTPLVKRLYNWADVREISERRMVAADGERRQNASCVVAVRP